MEVSRYELYKLINSELRSQVGNVTPTIGQDYSGLISIIDILEIPSIVTCC
jgi:hypothetical protein